MKKYRVVHYKNGLYEDVFRVQAWRWWLPVWIRVSCYCGYESWSILEFDTREDAERWIQQTEEIESRLRLRSIRIKVKEGA